MYDDSDDDLFLAPEAMVSLPFDVGSEDESDWDLDYGDARTHIERAAQARSVAPSNQFPSDLVAFDTDSEERPTLRDAIRLVMELP